METENNVIVEEQNEVIEQAQEPINDDVNSEESETLVEVDEHRGIGLAAGIAIVASGAAVLAGGKKLINKIRVKKMIKEGGVVDVKATPVNERKLTLKERITGKVIMEEAKEEKTKEKTEG